MNRCSKPSLDTPDRQTAAARPFPQINSATALIDCSALRNNLSVLSAINPKTATLIAVKANAYGHGLVKVTQALESGIDYVAVSRVNEGSRLRDAGIAKPIIVLSERLTNENAANFQQQRLTPCLFDNEDLEQQLSITAAYELPYWLKVNTGMNRLGISPLNVDSLRSLLIQEGIEFPKVIMSHLSGAEEQDDTPTMQQLELFGAFCESLPFPSSCAISLANSAASIKQYCASQNLQQFDVINRLGISLYGVAPGVTETLDDSNNLQTVMSLYAPVLAIQHVHKGETVGYNGTWTATRDSVIATVAIGYGDGYPRHAKSGTPVLFGQERAALVGRVSMDMIGVDITDLEQRESITAGSVACLWGRSLKTCNPSVNSTNNFGTTMLDVTEIARHCDSISYQLLTQISERVKRIY